MTIDPKIKETDQKLYISFEQIQTDVSIGQNNELDLMRDMVVEQQIDLLIAKYTLLEIHAFLIFFK
jgi:hypothetical protein